MQNVILIQASRALSLFSLYISSSLYLFVHVYKYPIPQVMNASLDTLMKCIASYPLLVTHLVAPYSRRCYKYQCNITT